MLPDSTDPVYDKEYSIDVGKEDVKQLRKRLKAVVRADLKGTSVGSGLSDENFSVIGITLAHARSYRLCFAISMLRLIGEDRFDQSFDMTGREVVALRFCGRRGVTQRLTRHVNFR